MYRCPKKIDSDGDIVDKQSSNTAVLERSSLQFSDPEAEDGAKMWELVKNSGVLDVNSSYTYLMMSKFFSETCIVAKEDDKLVGFVTAFLKPEADNTVFVWQIAVDQSQRGKGLGKQLLRELLTSDGCKQVRFLEATISPSNKASQALFKGVAKEFRTACRIKECFSADMFPGEGHEAELTYNIGPFKAQ